MRKISAFIRKIIDILSDQKISEIIGWNPEGTGFQIYNITRFTEKVLPAYYKHNNMASFVRQLNMYGFARLKNSEQHCYYHPEFHRDEPEKFKLIKRKSPTSKQYSDESEDISDRQSELKIIKKIREEKLSWEMLCKNLRIQNEALRLENERMAEKIQEYETLKENMNKFRMERAMWVEKNQSGGSTQTENSSNKGESNKQLKKASSNQNEALKKQACVLILQRPQRLSKNQQI